MYFDFENMTATQRYELLLGTVVPRPIALITTLTQDGVVNAAPYSLFSVMGHDPAIAMFSVLPHPDRRLKDTAANILATKEFVINLVPQSIASAMNVTCIDAPPGTSEIELANLRTSASIKVRPPRIDASPAAFECRFLTALSFAPDQAIIVGHMVHAFVNDEFVCVGALGSVDTPKLDLIGSMHAAKWYARTSDLFEMERPIWAEWVRLGKAT